MAIEPQSPVHGIFIVTKPASRVKLEITIGRAGEEGDTAVSLGSTDFGNHANTFTLDLGKATDIDGSLLHTTTTIQDLATDHNDLLYKIKLTAGPDTFYEKREKTVPNHGDGISIMAFITIITT